MLFPRQSMPLLQEETDMETPDVLCTTDQHKRSTQGAHSNVPDMSRLLAGGLTHVWTYYDNESPPFYETPCGILLMCPDITEGDITCLACLATR